MLHRRLSIAQATAGSVAEKRSNSRREESRSLPSGLARAQFAQDAEPYRVSYAETLYALVRGGLALGLMPRLYTASLRDANLDVLPLVKPQIERRVVLVYQSGPMRTEAVQALRAFCNCASRHRRSSRLSG